MAIANRGQKTASESTEVKERAPLATGRTDLNEQGKNILNQKSEEEQALLGSKSANLEFVALITNPYYPVTRKVNGKAVKGEETVGAIFRNVGEEPITVLTLPNKSYEVMDVDFEKVSQRTVAPGEEVQLNSAEVAELLTRDEYASVARGGTFPDGKEKVVTYTTQTPKDPSKLPTTKLRLNEGSVKDHAVSIADVSPDGKTKVLKDEFKEKFGIFSTRGTRSNSASGNSRKAQVNTAGLAVQALFKNKLGQSK